MVKPERETGQRVKRERTEDGDSTGNTGPVCRRRRNKTTEFIDLTDD
jgi:hypothetical protein